ncbi:uncharacterized protein LOC126381495 [Pectinophora gossypiella]|uniref:uncharacterized protein LOC126381495 n=1 Tax=Pectinophora gossypiella TaxID=13191 RepID=UPI00214E7937|nr:uncharacterized protein LOC126381495 [Pectinophora gossypiella]
MGKLSEAEKKEKKRIAERRRRERIKNDPILYERHKQRDRERYAKRKAEGKVKKMSERTRREQKALRKYFREHSKKSYEKKKQKNKVLEEKPISLPFDSGALNDHDPLSTSQTLGMKSPINIISVTEPQSPINTFADSSVPVSPATSESSSKEESAGLMKSSTKLPVDIKEAVVKFYEDDENSRMCPGKRDYRVRNKIRKQKRYATESLRDLHKKFQAQHPEIKISYSLFCRLRPFWVIIPNVLARETCSCQTHENFNFVVSALYKHKIISESSPNQILEKNCCDPRYVSCLTRVCLECNNKRVTYLEFDNSAEIDYKAWEKQKKAYFKNGEGRITLQTIKANVLGTTL